MSQQRGQGIRRITTISLASLTILWLSVAPALEPVRAGQDASITRAVFAESTLWLLTDAGTLSVIHQGADKRVEVPVEESALDLWLQDGDPTVVTTPRAGHGDFTVRRWRQGSWTVSAMVPADKDQFVGAGTEPGGATLVTSRRLIDVKGADYKVTMVAWPENHRISGVTSIWTAPNDVLIGINAGEWGGGLARVDRASGRVSFISRNDGGTTCGGPLNAECDPVNAIIPAHKPDCVLIAIGLVHFVPHGRIDEVCDTEVRRLYFKPYAVEGMPVEKIGKVGDEPFSTVAFFGLASIKDKILAVGLDGIYQIEPDGTAVATPLPEFRRVGNVWVSFALPDVVLLRTNVNQRRSVSGSVPMLVRR